MEFIYDYAVIGGGVVGCAIFNKLRRYGKEVVLIEKGYDVAVGTTKANSGIVHAGFDAKEGTLKAKLNVRGAELMPELCKNLNVPYVENGAVVIGNFLPTLQELYDRGIANGVKGLEILEREQLEKKLPCIADNVTCGLYASTSAIVSPYKLAIALAEEAVINGGNVMFNYQIKKFKKQNDYYMLGDGCQYILAKKIIVCVGVEHNNLSKILGNSEYPIQYRRGEYYLLDKGAMDINALTVFPLPTKESKGILITPTTSGNIIVGPTSIVTDSSETVTTQLALEEIAQKASTMLKNVNLNKNIRVFSGIRTVVGDDFVIEKDKNNSDILNVTGICSPGLTAAPAIAEYVCELLGVNDAEIEMKKLPVYKKLQGATADDINAMIAEDDRYGKIVCRCENVSEREIIDAINSPLKPITLDAIKRRTRAGMGRCQGGFCFSKVMEIISLETGMKIDDICKENAGSRIIVGDIKDERL